MRRVLKWDVPIDDSWHPVGSGKVTLVAIQFPETPGLPASSLQVWTEEECTPGGEPRNRLLAATVVGTGHKVPDFALHIGSVVSQAGALVWHVYREDR